MLIKVTKQKLILGRSVYQRGDIFECPLQEARMMAAIGLVQTAPDGAHPTRVPPVPPAGVNFYGPSVSALPARARRFDAAQAGE